MLSCSLAVEAEDRLCPFEIEQDGCDVAVVSKAGFGNLNNRTAKTRTE